MFVISWVNPDERLSHKTFEDYMQEGILTAADAVKRETGTEKINVVGYCVGGTLLGDRRSPISPRAARSRSPRRPSWPPRSTSPRPAICLLFTDDDQLEALKELMAERGYLDGSRMANVFNMLRPRDLIWPYIVNNYLLGKKPFPFDLLFWNQDFDADGGGQPQLLSARVLRREPPRQGQMTIAGTRLDLGKVKLPIYELCDEGGPHRAGASRCSSARSCSAARSSSCCRARATSPASSTRRDKVKYQYWTNGKKRRDARDVASDGARSIPAPGGRTGPSGSPSIPATGSCRAQPGAMLGAIEDAPGSYVKAKH